MILTAETQRAQRTAETGGAATAFAVVTQSSLCELCASAVN
jgi:hypothetical protein